MFRQYLLQFIFFRVHPSGFVAKASICVSAGRAAYIKHIHTPSTIDKFLLLLEISSHTTYMIQFRDKGKFSYYELKITERSDDSEFILLLR